MAKVAIGGGSCQVLANLDHVPEVGETITIREDQVIGAKGIGMGLVEVPILVTHRDDEGVKIEGEQIPRIWARTLTQKEREAKQQGSKGPTEFARIRVVPHGTTADRLWMHLEAIGVRPEHTDPHNPEVVFIFDEPRRNMFPPDAHIVWVATEETRNRAVAAEQGGARASVFTYEGGEPHEHLVNKVDEVIFIDDPNIERYLKRIVTVAN